MRIDWKNISIKDLAGLVCGHLKKNGVEATLVGGACVSIYSKNKYVSGDLDFITYTPTGELEKVLNALGFARASRRHFEHPDCEFFIEFPAPPVSIGSEPVRDFLLLKTKFGSIRILTPTDCVRDRLAAYFFWDDMQSFDQALLVARGNDINMPAIREWAKREGNREKFRKFRSELKKKQNNKR